jgi:hypothetical protein
MFDQMALQKTHTHTHTRITYHQKPQDACKPLTVDRCHCAREPFRTYRLGQLYNHASCQPHFYVSAQPFHRCLLLAHANCAQIGLSPFVSTFFFFANGHHNPSISTLFLFYKYASQHINVAHTSRSLSSSLNTKVSYLAHIHTHAQPHRSRRPDRKGSAELPVSGERGRLGYVRLRAGLVGSR